MVSKNIPPSKFESPGAPPRQPNQGLKVKVDVANMDIFKSVLSVMEFLFANAREEVKREAAEKMEKAGILNLYNK